MNMGAILAVLVHQNVQLAQVFMLASEEPVVIAQLSVLPDMHVVVSVVTA